MLSMSEVVDLIKKGATMELQEKIMDLRQATLDLQEENVELKSRVRDLESKLSLRVAMLWMDGYYWQEGDPAPFCPHCFEAKHQAVHLFASRSTAFRWTCPQCKTIYQRTDGRGETAG
jgi:hypothetical protein